MIRLISDSKYGGYTISMLYHDLIILMHPEEYEGGVIEVINAHEGYHARYKHTVILNAILFISLPTLIYYGVRGLLNAVGCVAPPSCRVNLSVD